jgi:phage portal protein BeeE
MAFKVPAYMINAAPAPAYNNIEALNQQYYSQCLQSLIEAIELSLDEGLSLPSDVGVEFDVENGLMRMDSATRIKNAVESIKGVAAPNEARAKLNLPPVPGGEHPYLQQQNYSLAALAKRDAQDDPFRAAPPPAPVVDDPAPEKAINFSLVIKGVREGLQSKGAAA